MNSKPGKPIVISILCSLFAVLVLVSPAAGLTRVIEVEKIGVSSARALPAQQGSTGAITGYVTGTDGTIPLSDINVDAYCYETGVWVWVGSTITYSVGDYILNGLAAGTYKLEFRDWSGKYLTEFYNNAFDLNSATVINVTAGATTSGIDISLARSRHIGNINQPRFAQPGAALSVPIDFYIPNQGSALSPRWGVKLPPGWSVANTPTYNGNNSGTLTYSPTLAADLSGLYGGTWWAGQGPAANWNDTKTTLSLTLQSPAAPGDYRLEYLIGDNNNAWGDTEVAPILLTSQYPIKAGSVAAMRDQSGYVFGERVSTSLQTAKGLGLTTVYHYLGWNTIETRPGYYDWDMLDDAVSQAQAYNLKIVLRIYNPPQWYTASGSLAAALAQDHYIRAFSQNEIQDFMEALTRHVKENDLNDTIAGYIIWNEPNIASGWDNQPPNAAAYMAMLQAAYTGAKEGDPAAKIISAPLAPTADQPNVAINDLTYLGQLYDLGLANYTDYVGMNGLGFQYDPDYDPGLAAYSFTRLKYLHDLMVSKGDSARKVWAMEVGWLRNNPYDLGEFNAYKVSDTQQSQYITRAFQKAAAEWPWLGLLSIWNLDFNRYYPPTSNFYWYTLASATGVITGRVTAENGVALKDVSVWLYQPRNGWWFAAESAQTDRDGRYRFDLPGGDYRLYFYDPAGQYRPEYYNNTLPFDFNNAATVTVQPGQTLANIDAQLAAITPPLFEVTGDTWHWNNPDTGKVSVGAPRGGGLVTINMGINCGSVPTNVRLNVGSNSFPMTAQGNNYYNVTLLLPDNLPAGASSANLSVQYTCGIPVEIQAGYITLYDPSGRVTSGGQPVAGATVSLYRLIGARPDVSNNERYDCRTIETRAGGLTGDWRNELAATLDAGSFVNPDLFAINNTPEISPTINPQVTGQDGRFGWDVVAGCWYVVVEAKGYQTNISPLVGVPPLVTDLNIRLTASNGLYLPIILKR